MPSPEEDILNIPPSQISLLRLKASGTGNTFHYKFKIVRAQDNQITETLGYAEFKFTVSTFLWAQKAEQSSVQYGNHIITTSGPPDNIQGIINGHNAFQLTITGQTETYTLHPDWYGGGHLEITPVQKSAIGIKNIKSTATINSDQILEFRSLAEVQSTLNLKQSLNSIRAFLKSGKFKKFPLIRRDPISLCEPTQDQTWSTLQQPIQFLTLFAIIRHHTALCQAITPRPGA